MKLLKKPQTKRSVRTRDYLGCSSVAQKKSKIKKRVIRDSRVSKFSVLSETLKSVVGDLFVDQKDINQSVRQARGRVIKRIYGKDI
ncbi:hypothetical protein [Desulfoscipio gibsoniae]